MYLGLSPLLNAAGDRRRFIYYAKYRKFLMAKPGEKNIDCIIATEGVDLSAMRRNYPGTPIIYDLIDAYLTADNHINDYARGMAKVLTGRIELTALPFTKVVARNCRIANAVICSSPEQEKIVRLYNRNVHVILDSHDEFPLLEFRRKKISNSSVLWEGSPYTLSAIGEYGAAFRKLGIERDPILNFVTDEFFFKYLGKFKRTKTIDTNKKLLRNLGCKYSFIPWSLQNVSKTAENSLLGIVPVRVESSFQRLKPENRMLIMWRLGLPCIVSATPSHLRIAAVTNLQNTFTDSESCYTQLLQILDNEEKQEENVKRGQDYLTEYHNFDIFLASWDNVFASVL